MPFNEQLVEERSTWLAGVLEAGGTFAFAIQDQVRKGRRYTYSYPLMSLTDQDEERVKLFLSFLGGLNRWERNSYTWRLTGEKVAWIASLIASYAPSRNKAIIAMANWEVSSLDERVQIARDMKKHDRKVTVSYQDYLSLVSDPGFSAGVVDYRGSFSSVIASGGPERGYPTVRIYNSNRPLLEAFNKVYGGRLRVHAPKGSAKTVNGRSFITDRDSLFWTPELGATRGFVDLISSNLLLSKREIEARF